MESDHQSLPAVVLSAEAQAQMQALAHQQVQQQQAQAQAEVGAKSQGNPTQALPRGVVEDDEGATNRASTGGLPILLSPRTPIPRTMMTAFPSLEADEFQRFTTSRRSVVYSTKGMICCTQPLAARAGVKILEKGGNAADAAVAIAAALNVTEPMSTGIGGDMFCLFYDGRTKAVKGLNATGRSGAKMTYPAVRSALGLDAPDAVVGNIPIDSAHAVIVPGAAAGWCDVLEHFGSGRMSMMDVLTPGMKLAYEGFPVSEVTSHAWRKHEPFLLSSLHGRELLIYDPQLGTHRAPRAGEIFTNPSLATTFLELGTRGKRGFYTGRIASSIVSVVQDKGGFLTHEDMAHHLTASGAGTSSSDLTEPICYDFRGQGLSPEDGSNLVVWEHAPNSQGLIALIALGLFEEFERAGKIPRFQPADFLGVEYVHAIIEAVRIAFKEGARYIGDPEEGSTLHNRHAARHILSRIQNQNRGSSTDTGSSESNSPILERWARQFDPTKAISPLAGAETVRGSDTVYFSVVDSAGNAVSFVNSNFAEFGSGLVPQGTGFVLHNRGAGFGLDPRKENCLFPRRRPYHTLIPGLVTYGTREGDEETANTSGAAGSNATTMTQTAQTMQYAPSGLPRHPLPGSLHSVFGVKGGFVQPQGHLQVLLAQIVGKCNPQQALDCPRVCVGPGMPDPKLGGRDGAPDARGSFGGDWTVQVEEGMPEATIEGLRRLGHKVVVSGGWDRQVFGRGQVVRCVADPGTGRKVYMGGSDGRGDGIVMPL